MTFEAKHLAGATLHPNLRPRTIKTVRKPWRCPMSGRSLKLLLLALTVATVGMANPIKDEATLQRISGYRNWSRVTKKPLTVDFSSLAG
jgi:hypothetical protein